MFISLPGINSVPSIFITLILAVCKNKEGSFANSKTPALVG